MVWPLQLAATGGTLGKPPLSSLQLRRMGCWWKLEAQWASIRGAEPWKKYNCYERWHQDGRIIISFLFSCFSSFYMCLLWFDSTRKPALEFLMYTKLQMSGPVCSELNKGVWGMDFRKNRPIIVTNIQAEMLKKSNWVYECGIQDRNMA